ncbi:MAG TPA: LCP family protein [Solirubrobacteraceae bacterium]|nr:LCP family protein [Solirubrobacteraceae bacterium]
MPKEPDDRPDYRVYRARPRLFRRDEAADPRAGLDELRGDAPQRAPAAPQRPAAAPPPQYELHRAGRGPRLPRPGPRRPRPGRAVAGLTFGRIVKWIAVAATGWIVLSAVLFLVSAQIQRANVSEAARGALDDGGYTLTSPNNILVLGSDARTKGLAEPGSRIGGPSRADSILLIRAGGGSSARLSIPRDTVVDIPGHGRNKVNAAYAIGGPSLTIETLKQYLGIEIHHVVEVNFENFPQFIDALGGIDIRTGCVVSRINGGTRNGGYTLRLRGGENHINGKQALALARTRKNDCNPREDDLTRVRRQQKIMAAIKSRLTSPITFLRLPWVGWAAPKAIRSDMAGPALLGLFGAVVTGGDPATHVLKPSGGQTLPDGGSGLVVSEAERASEVARFLRG